MFGFKKLCEPDPVEEDGNCRITGELLKQLKALEPNKCLRLTSKEDGREYQITLVSNAENRKGDE